MSISFSLFNYQYKLIHVNYEKFKTKNNASIIGWEISYNGIMDEDYTINIYYNVSYLSLYYMLYKNNPYNLLYKFITFMNDYVIRNDSSFYYIIFNTFNIKKLNEYVNYKRCNYNYITNLWFTNVIFDNDFLYNIVYKLL